MSLTNAIKERECLEHRLRYLGKCPLCEAGVEPIRFVEAREDFAGVPLAGTVNILPHHKTVDIHDVIRTVGLQLAELERRQREAVAPYEAAKKVIYKDLRKAYMDPKVFNQAVRVYLEIPGSESFANEPGVQAVLELMRREP